MLIHGGTMRSGRFSTFSVVGVVLDELAEVVLVDDLAGRGGEVLAELEFDASDLADLEVAAARP